MGCECWSLYAAVFNEVVAVGRAAGISIPAEKAQARLARARTSIPMVMPSMAVDLIAGNRLHPLFVAEVTGIDCSAPISREDFRTIWEAFNEHQILVFRDQHFDDASQIAFSSRFNDLETMIAHRATTGIPATFRS